MVRNFEDSDYNEIAEWYHGWKMPLPKIEVLPSVGLIVEGIAAGFLISTDTDLAILDFFISNPNSEKELRDKALDEIVTGLLEKGRDELGYSNFKADTQLTCIADRAIKFGFEYIGDYSNFFLKDYTWAV